MANSNGHAIPDISTIIDSQEDAVYQLRTKAPGPQGKLPLQIEEVVSSPSGNIFAYSQNAGMGWNPAELGRKEFLILPHRPLGSWPAHGSGGPGDPPSRWHTVRRLLFRPV